MEADGVCECVEEANVGRAVVVVVVMIVVVVDSVVLDAVDVWLSLFEESWLYVRFSGTLVLLKCAGVFTVGPALPEGKPL